MAFTTKIKRARFVVGPFSSEAMQTIGQVVADDIKARILRGENATDSPSKPLKPKYEKYKTSRGRAPIRDWFMRGLTLGSLKVKSANENRVAIGFVNPQADTIAHIQNARERAFGMSPKNVAAYGAVVHATAKQARVVRTVKVA